MKILYTTLFLIITTLSFGQTRALNKFINHHKTADNALAISVPGWMLDIVGYSARVLDEDDEEAREILALTDNISKVRVLIVEENTKISSDDINHLINGLKRDKFEELITVRSEEANIRLLIKERRNIIKNITAVIEDDDQLILMTLSGRFDLDELKEMDIWKEAQEDMMDSI